MNTGDNNPGELGQAREFFMAAPVIIGYVKGKDYVIELANDGLLEVWGRGREVIGLPLTTAIPELASQGFTDLLDEVCRTGTLYYAYGYPISLVRNGVEDVYYFDFIYKPYYGNGQSEPPTGVISVGHDVTAQVKARKLAEDSEVVLQKMVDERTADLQRLVRDLERSNQSLERFAYAASHDLKAPIRKVQLFSQSLYDRLYSTMEPADQRSLARILDASRRMNTLIDDLLVYAHVSTGTTLGESVDLNLVVNEVLQDLDIEIEEQHANIVAETLPSVKGNAGQLRQLFQNLLSNALKYSKPDTDSKIMIRYLTGAEALGRGVFPISSRIDKFHCISIEDNGIGFAQADAQRIFQIFTRLHANSKYPGTGVGLAIVDKIVENHKGIIHATSEQGKGSTFYIMLPLSEV